MFCKKCGTKVKREYTFCPICGAMMKVRVSKKSDVDMEVLSDAIKELKAGNEEGFSLIYFHTYKFVYNRAKYMLKDEQEAQDLTQDVYMTLYNGIDEIKDEKAIYGWLKTVVFRQSLKVIEKKRKYDILSEEAEFLFDTLPDERTGIEEAYGKKEDIRTVKKCIDMLSEDQRLVVLAYYYDEMSVKEIARVLEISEGTVKSRLYLARKHLNTLLESEEEKQGYKFFGAGLPLIAPALDDSMKANVNIAKKTIIENYKSFCGKSGFEETSALVKTTGIAEKTALMIASIGFKKIIITIASFIVVGVVCGVFLITGGNQINGIAAGQKYGKEVVLTKMQSESTAESADNTENVGDASDMTNTSDSGNASNASESGSSQNSEENGNSEGNNAAAQNDGNINKPVNVATVGGLRYNFAPNSDDLNLSWDPVEGADGYEVYVATSEFPDYKLDNTVTTTKCAVLTGGVYYHVKVRAFSNQNGKKVYGQFCGEVSTEPEVVFPQNITITSIKQEEDFITMNVKPFTVNYPAEVELFRSTSIDGNYESAGSVECNPKSSLTVTSMYDGLLMQDNTTYYYKIRIKAYKTWPSKSDKYSNYSNIVSYEYNSEE